MKRNTLLLIALITIMGCATSKKKKYQAYDRITSVRITGTIDSLYTTTYGKQTLKWKVIKGQHIHYWKETKPVGSLDTVYVRPLIHNP